MLKVKLNIKGKYYIYCSILLFQVFIYLFELENNNIEVIKMRKNNSVVPEARIALNSFKEEIAKELGLQNST